MRFFNNPEKRPWKWVTGVVTVLIIGFIAPLITGSGARLVGVHKNLDMLLIRINKFSPHFGDFFLCATDDNFRSCLQNGLTT